MTYTRCWIFLGILSAFAAPAFGQSFRVQCPTSTITHPDTTPTQLVNSSEPAYTKPTYPASSTDYTTGNTGGAVNGAIKCQQISGGDGYASMGDGTQTYMFSFGPLSGLPDIAAGGPGTVAPTTFNTPYPVNASASNALPPGYPDVMPATGAVDYHGAIGLANETPHIETVYDASESGQLVTIVLNTVVPFAVGDQVIISGVGPGYDSRIVSNAAVPWTVTKVGVPNPFFNVAQGTPNGASYAFQYTAIAAGLAEVAQPASGTAADVSKVTGHVDARQAMDVGVMNGNIPAPLMAIDEDDEFFLTLTNVGMIMRPDLFEQHTVHFHGYPNASAFYDGVPDASVAINIGGSFTYYYLAPDAGTYFWHCHITPPEHLQMGMVGQLYVRPRQNRWSGDLYTGLNTQQGDLRTACSSATDILCSNPLPAVQTGASNTGVLKYAYNDGDGSTYYDVEYPLQMHAFDPNFHFVGMTFNPEGFADMKDKYFMLNGRSYPDTVTSGPLQTPSVDGVNHFSQPLPSIISIPAGKRALLRISELNVSEYHTLASLGIPMQVIGYNAKLLRDQAGNNLYYTTNSITLGGGESLDVILDTCAVRPTVTTSTGTPGTGPDYTKCTTAITAGTYYLYTPNLDHLSNDAENFGGQMTEVRVTPN